VRETQTIVVGQRAGWGVKFWVHGDGDDEGERRLWILVLRRWLLLGRRESANPYSELIVADKVKPCAIGTQITPYGWKYHESANAGHDERGLAVQYYGEIPLDIEGEYKSSQLCLKSSII
jgi:hypothetical protein